jgi:hypothetical protein
MIAGEYGRDEFPYAGIFEDLTLWAIDTQATPLEAYLYYRRARRELELTPCPDYASTSITSGGHARRDDLTNVEIIDSNTDTARRTVRLLATQGSADPRATILPVDVGYIRHWRQSDYMELWSLAISGIDLGLNGRAQRVAEYERRFEDSQKREMVNLDIMNDGAVDPRHRALEYFAFAKAFSQTARAQAVDATPVRRVVSLIDTDTSLGCQTERLLAKLLGLPVHKLVAVAPAESYEPAISDLELRGDFATFIRYGAASIDLASEAKLVTLCLDPGDPHPANGYLTLYGSGARAGSTDRDTAVV